MNFKVVFRKIADVKRERELAETRKNEDFDQISSDHPVRKLISKFRKISQESRAAASQNNPNPLTSSIQANNISQMQNQLTTTIPETIVQPASAEPMENSPLINRTLTQSSALQLLQLPATSAAKQREKLETISERIETQESQVSQITSVNQSPPLQRPPKASKWKWLKTGSTEPDQDSSASKTTLTSTVKSSAAAPPPVAPQPEQQTKNPFDPNLSDDDFKGKSVGNERQAAIPMSLFIPRSARRDSVKTTEEGSQESVMKRVSFSFSQ